MTTAQQYKDAGKDLLCVKGKGVATNAGAIEIFRRFISPFILVDLPLFLQACSSLMVEDFPVLYFIRSTLLFEGNNHSGLTSARARIASMLSSYIALLLMATSDSSSLNSASAPNLCQYLPQSCNGGLKCPQARLQLLIQLQMELCQSK